MRQTKPKATSFRRSLSRALLTVAMIMLAQGLSPSPAHAQDEDQPRWFGTSFSNKTALVFGVPESDYVVLWFQCQQGKPVVSVGVQDEESNADEGDLMLVRLAANGEAIEFSNKVRLNHESGGIEVDGSLPLDPTMRRILSATDRLEIVIDGHTQDYDMAGAAEPAARMIAACDAPRPVDDLDVTVTNKARLPLQSFAYSEAGVNDFDSDSFGYEPLAPGESRTFTIPNGRTMCSFDVSVLFEEEEDEECCSMGAPAGTQNLCENSEFIVHDQTP